MFYRYWKKIASLIVLGIIFILLVNSAWFLKFFYPFPHQNLVIKYSSEYKVDPYLVLAIIRTESRFYSKAHSQVGAKGLMQIMPETGEWIAREIKLGDYTEDKLFQPQYNIPMGIWYLSYLDKVFKGDLPKLLASYNAGERKVKKWLNEGIWTGKLQDIDQIPYEETRKYVERVLFDYQVYKRIYKKSC
ncbi:lytic transglycosylase domain-containing protein [Thermanaerosceptrum fracticalcis]|uniref:lytic transglycosylase domain-containing protein n=1 Tax=Thermanaerosceptrum fracticalcis TaxID=1712410 RepID=UPI0005579480|nr:lytic transglycosylase domain-containing protein [Thermanaerosceptrum fracticalcis]